MTDSGPLALLFGCVSFRFVSQLAASSLVCTPSRSAARIAAGTTKCNGAASPVASSTAAMHAAAASGPSSVFFRGPA